MSDVVPVHLELYGGLSGVASRGSSEVVRLHLELARFVVPRLSHDRGGGAPESAPRACPTGFERAPRFILRTQQRGLSALVIMYRDVVRESSIDSESDINDMEHVEKWRSALEDNPLNADAWLALYRAMPAGGQVIVSGDTYTEKGCVLNALNIDRNNFNAWGQQ